MNALTQTFNDLLESMLEQLGELRVQEGDPYRSARRHSIYFTSPTGVHHRISDHAISSNVATRDPKNGLLPKTAFGEMDQILIVKPGSREDNYFQNVGEGFTFKYKFTTDQSADEIIAAIAAAENWGDYQPLNPKFQYGMSRLEKIRATKDSK